MESLRGTKILFIEDDVFVGDIIARKLTEAGALCEWVEDGFAALGKTHKEDFDIIITDLRMEAMSGSEMLSKMRTQESTKDVPVIVLTNLSRDDEEVAKAQELHVAGFLSKSSTSAESLIGVICGVLNPGAKSGTCETDKYSQPLSELTQES